MSILNLDECIGVQVSPEVRRSLPVAAFNRVVQAFQPREPALVILDNVDDAMLLSPMVLDVGIVEATTRLSQLPQNSSATLDAAPARFALESERMIQELLGVTGRFQVSQCQVAVSHNQR